MYMYMYLHWASYMHVMATGDADKQCLWLLTEFTLQRLPNWTEAEWDPMSGHDIVGHAWGGCGSNHLIYNVV